jgi:hypothetical protein
MSYWTLDQRRLNHENLKAMQPRISFPTTSRLLTGDEIRRAIPLMLALRQWFMVEPAEHDTYRLHHRDHDAPRAIVARATQGTPGLSNGLPLVHTDRNSLPGEQV